MVSEQQSDRPEEGQELVVPDSRDIAHVEVKEPKAPKGMSEEERAELRTRAEELIRELSGADGAKEMELVDSVTNVGMQAQRSSGVELNLLRVRVRDLLSQEGVGSDIAGNLVDLRITLNEINPDELSKPGRMSFVPIIGRIPTKIKVLQKIAIRYEPVSRQIDAIEKKLREGRMMLTRDNVELRQVYERVEEQRFPIQKNAYLGELLMAELQALIDRSDDPLNADRIREALYDVSIRVMNLRTMDTVYGQFKVAIEMTRRNNTRLGNRLSKR